VAAGAPNLRSSMATSVHGHRHGVGRTGGACWRLPAARSMRRCLAVRRTVRARG
jgi:hypothetical protein